MSTSHRSTTGYKIELRVKKFSNSNPIKIGDMVLSEKWLWFRPSYSNNPAGVPGDLWGDMRNQELLPYQSALALAHTVIAQNCYNGWGDIEARLVAYSLVIDTACKREGIVDIPVICHDFMDAHKIKVVEENDEKAK